jgi:hypothetical protein
MINSNAPVERGAPADGAALISRTLVAALGRLALPTLAELVFLACLALSIAKGSTMVSADGDPARHLTVGERILSTGAIPRADVFSHTMAGEPFMPYEWLSEVASALAHRLLGLAGPVLLHGGAAGLAFAILFRQLRARGATPGLALGVCLFRGRGERAPLAGPAARVHLPGDGALRSRP